MADGGKGGVGRHIVPILSFLLEIAGIGAIVWGFFLIAPFAGFLAGGVGLILLGLAVDPPLARKTKRIEGQQE